MTHSAEPYYGVNSYCHFVAKRISNERTTLPTAILWSKFTVRRESKRSYTNQKLGNKLHARVLQILIFLYSYTLMFSKLHFKWMHDLTTEISARQKISYNKEKIWYFSEKKKPHIKWQHLFNRHIAVFFFFFFSCTYQDI